MGLKSGGGTFKWACEDSGRVDWVFDMEIIGVTVVWFDELDRHRTSWESWVCRESEIFSHVCKNGWNGFSDIGHQQEAKLNIFQVTA